MNCREAETRIYAARDGALPPAERTALTAHLERCAGCRRIHEDITEALAAWRREAAGAKVPDAEREWYAVRRRIRGAAQAGEALPVRPWGTVLSWLAMPFGAAAALAVALFIAPPGVEQASVAAAAGHAARAESLEVSADASAMVYVDGRSGWLIVSVSDAPPRRG